MIIEDKPMKMQIWLLSFLLISQKVYANFLYTVPQKASGFLHQLKSKAYGMFSTTKGELNLQGPSKGPQNAKIVIVEFSDFECPFCRVAQNPLRQVLATYPNQVRLVFRDFPSPAHSHASVAAQAGHCAEEQGKFWEMHDLMFTIQTKLTISEIQSAANKLGLNLNQFQNCLSSKKYIKVVQESVMEGQKLEITATPTFFINGKKLIGAQPFEKFKKVIDMELQAK